MILQCPGCGTRFLVDSALIPPEGREVKCAKCAHQWHVASDQEGAKRSAHYMEARVGDDHPEAYHDEEHGFEGAGQTVDSLPNLPEHEPEMPSFGMSGGYDIPPAPRLPAVTEAPKVSLTALIALSGLLVVGVLVASLFAFRTSLQPTIPWAYSALGMPRTDGLALADVVLRQRPLRSKSRYVVEGFIVNEAKEPRAIPVLRVAIVDKQGEWLTSREYETDVTLKPGESFPFKASNLETTFVDRVDHLLVDLGNGVELMLRK